MGACRTGHLHKAQTRRLHTCSVEYSPYCLSAHVPYSRSEGNGHFCCLLVSLSPILIFNSFAVIEISYKILRTAETRIGFVIEPDRSVDAREKNDGLIYHNL